MRNYGPLFEEAIPVNVVGEREMPGLKLSRHHFQTICCRYYFAGRYVKGKQVLEIGCGAGLGLGYLAKRARKVIGGDCSEDAVRCAQEHYRGRDGIGLLLLDAHKLPFRDACFDVVVVMEVVYYLPEPDKFIRECRRVLKNDGILALCIINKDAPGFHGSLLASRYFSSTELFALLSQHFHAELFGAFPISGGVALQKLQAAMTLIAGKALSLTPKGREVKKFFGKPILSKTIILEGEITDSMVNNFEFRPLSCDSTDFRYRYLYAIGRAR